MVTSKTLSKIFFIQHFQHDLYSSHSKNVSDLTYKLANQINIDYPELGLTKDYIEKLRLAALLHDIGKIFIPYHILAKPDTLTMDEYMIIQAHTTKGYQFIQSVFNSSILTKEDKELVRMCKDVCLHHQERLDGTGYPHKLDKKSMSIAAKITAITDSFDAMTSERIYKIRIPHQEALLILKKEKDKYDEKFINSFEKMLQK